MPIRDEAIAVRASTKATSNHINLTEKSWVRSVSAAYGVPNGLVTRFHAHKIGICLSSVSYPYIPNPVLSAAQPAFCVDQLGNYSALASPRVPCFYRTYVHAAVRRGGDGRLSKEGPDPDKLESERI